MLVRQLPLLFERLTDVIDKMRSIRFPEACSLAWGSGDTQSRQRAGVGVLGRATFH